MLKFITIIFFMTYILFEILIIVGPINRCEKHQGGKKTTSNQPAKVGRIVQPAECPAKLSATLYVWFVCLTFISLPVM